MKRVFPINVPFPGLGDLALIMLFVGAVWAAPQIADDPGLGWHLRTGEWIAVHQQIPMSDPFLATSGTRSWVANQWLSDLLLWKTFALGSWPVLHALSAILLLAPFLILSANAAREGEGGVTLFLALTLCALVSTVQWIIRPVILSFVLFAALYALLRRYERAEKTDWVVLLALPPLFLVWANLHPGFPMGFFLVAIVFVSLLIQGRTEHGLKLGIASLCAAGAPLINPYDVRLVKNIFTLVGSEFFMELNTEWYSPDFLSAARVPVLIVLAIILFCSSRKSSLSEILSVSFFFLLSLLSVRYLPFFAYVSVLPLTRALDSLQLLRKLPLRGGSSAVYTAVATAIFAGVVIYRGEIPRLPAAASAPSAIYPEGAIATIVADNDGGAVFSSPDWGGFLTFQLYPLRLAFIDDRNELSGEALYKSYFQIVQAREDWKGVLDSYDITWMLLTPSDPVGFALSREPGWTLAGESDVYKLFRRKRV